jgi:palmitoyl-protein thioesterase
MPRSLSSSSRTRRSPLPSLLLFSALFVADKNASGEDDAGRRNLVVLVHGMGDTCCNPHSLGAIERAILEREGRNNNNNNNNTSKVISIKFGRNGMSDFISGFIGNAYALVEDFGCKQLRRAKEEEEEEEGEKIDGETIVLGFSQGGVFARAMVETCEDEVNKLITFGSPHSGVWKFPGCDKMESALSRKWCEYSRKAASKAAYSKMLKSKSVQASYFRDVSDIQRFTEYKKSGSLLSVINGEGDASSTKQSQRRREKMCNLDTFAMFSFEKDEVVVPRDSAVFSDAPSIPFEYTEEKASELLNVRETKFYKNEEDGLCLRELDGKKRMKIDVVPNANHMQFSLEWFTEHVIEKYLIATPEEKEEEKVTHHTEDDSFVLLKAAR